MNPTVLIGVGIVTGIMAGFFGVGGGIVLVPVLVLWFKFSQHQAHGLSLAALLFPVGILGVLNYYKAYPFPIKTALWIALGIFVGTYFGSKMAQHLSDKTLKTMFGALMIVVGIKLILGK